MPYEFVTEEIRQSRKEYADDILQSSRGGVLNKARLDKYGTEGLKVTQEDVDNAEYVFAGDIDSEPYRESTGKNI